MDANASVAVHIQVDTALGPVQLQGIVSRPEQARGMVVFAHGSGSGRLSPRNQSVAATLQEAGFATLLFDLLTAEEEQRERYTRHLRFDITLLAQRLIATTRWLRTQPALATLPIGYFGASTGAAAALVAAADVAAMHTVETDAIEIAAVVSRGGRPDLAGAALAQVHAPTLLIVGSNDTEVIELNRLALAQLRGIKALELVPQAGHLFEEPGTLALAARLAVAWFDLHLHAEGAPR